MLDAPATHGATSNLSVYRLESRLSVNNLHEFRLNDLFRFNEWFDHFHVLFGREIENDTVLESPGHLVLPILIDTYLLGFNRDCITRFETIGVDAIKRSYDTVEAG